MTTEANKIKTSELDTMFNIGKNNRVNRLAMLGFTPDRLVKEGRFYYLNREQLQVFADFNKYILETGSSDGYPKLLANYSDNSSPSIAEPKVISETLAEEESPAGELTTQALENSDSFLEQSSLFSNVTSKFTEIFENPSADRAGNLLAQQVAASAQRKAVAILLAEKVLADQYINNPDLLDPELRAQVDSFQFTQIDPKELAASLVAAAQRPAKAA
jgi:hypothetical protein